MVPKSMKSLIKDEVCYRKRMKLEEEITHVVHPLLHIDVVLCSILPKKWDNENVVGSLGDFIELKKVT